MRIILKKLAPKLMILIKKGEANIKTNSPSCTVWEYLFPSKKLGFALTRMHGRYPGAGKMVNEKVDEVFYVISGHGVIHLPEGDFPVNKGDAIFIARGSIYWVEGEELFMAVPNAPAWYVEQYQHLD